MADQTLARYVNELAILTTLRTQGPTSRAVLSRRLALTPATMSRLVGEMARRGLLRETEAAADRGGAREPGRPAVNVEINPQGAFFLGVEIGVGVVRFALLDLAAAVVNSTVSAVPADIAPDAVTRRIGRRLDKLERDPRFAGKIRSVGVTVPGLVTLDGHVVHLPILRLEGPQPARAAAQVGVAALLHRKQRRRRHLGSVYTQPSLPSDCTIFLNSGTGSRPRGNRQRRLVRGAFGTAGEFGHLRIAANGPKCYCGQRLRWRPSSISRRWRALRGPRPRRRRVRTGLPDEIAEAARDGGRARRAVDSPARHLAAGLVALVNVFNPSTIVLGGVMQPLLEPLIPRLKAAVAAGIVPGGAVPEIRMSALGLLECAIGAATVAHHHSFDVWNFDLSQRELAF